MHTIISMYADGGVIGPNPSMLGGTWAYCLVDMQGLRIQTDSGIILPAPARVHPSGFHDYEVGTKAVECNQSEFYAFLRGLRSLPDGWSGNIYSDSKNTIGRFFHGYGMSGIPDRWQQMAIEQVRRLGKLCPILLDGHPTRAQLLAGIGKRGQPVSEHNCWCDQECTRLAELRKKEGDSYEARL